MPAHVAYLVNQYPKVSHTFVRREILALERQGFRVDRYAMRGWDAEIADPADQGERARTRYLLRNRAAMLLATLESAVLSPGRFLRALGKALRLGWRADRPLGIHLAYLAEACLLAAWLKKSGALHLHAHFGTNPAAVALLTRMLGGPAFSFTVHGPEEFEKAGVLALADKVAGAAFVVTVSAHGRRALEREIGMADRAKINVVHCGLEAASFAAAPSPPAGNRLVCVGRICEQKAQHLLVEAAAKVVARGWALELLFLGDGELRSRLEEQIIVRGLRKCARIAGWVDSGRVRAEILAARALVLCSRAEGLPVAIMEAMALRRPVVSTDVAGIPELVVPGETGWLVPVGDVDALASALEAVLSRSPDELASLGERAYRRALERHSIDIEAAKLGGLFRRASGAA